VKTPAQVQFHPLVPIPRANHHPAGETRQGQGLIERLRAAGNLVHQISAVCAAALLYQRAGRVQSIGAGRVIAGGYAQFQRGRPAARVAVKRHQRREREARQQCRGQQPDDAQPEHASAFCDQWTAVEHEIHRGFHIGQKDGRFGRDVFRDRDQLIRCGGKSAFMRVKGEDHAPHPGRVDPRPGVRHLPHAGIAVLERKGKPPLQR